jgi:DHA2 family multidrug resistance protein-like MFS transporter
LFTQRTGDVVLGSMISYSMVSSGVLVFIAQYFQLVQGMPPLAASTALIPGMVTSTMAFQLAPRMAQRIRPGVLIPGGLACTAIGMAVMAVANSTTVLVVAFAVQCVGAAPLSTLGTHLVIASAPPQQAGSAFALTQTGIELGHAVGIAVMGSVVTVTYRNLMDGQGGNSLGEAITDAAPPVVLNAARDAFTTGVHIVAGISAVVLTVVGILLARALRALPVLGDDRRGRPAAPVFDRRR